MKKSTTTGSKTNVKNPNNKNHVRRSISEKAYSDFTTRLNETLNLFCADSLAFTQAKSLLDNYIDGKNATPEITLENCSHSARIAFLMIKPEIDKAINRSRSARERAAERKAAKSAEANNSPEIYTTDSVPVSPITNPDRPLNRRERRSIQQELARDSRRLMRKLRREQLWG